MIDAKEIIVSPCTLFFWMGINGLKIAISGGMTAKWLEGGYGAVTRELRALIPRLHQTNQFSIRPKRRHRFGEGPLMS